MLHTSWKNKEMLICVDVQVVTTCYETRDQAARRHIPEYSNVPAFGGVFEQCVSSINDFHLNCI